MVRDKHENGEPSDGQLLALVAIPTLFVVLPAVLVTGLIRTEHRAFLAVGTYGLAPTVAVLWLVLFPRLRTWLSTDMARDAKLVGARSPLALELWAYMALGIPLFAYYGLLALTIAWNACVGVQHVTVIKGTVKDRSVSRFTGFVSATIETNESTTDMKIPLPETHRWARPGDEVVIKVYRGSLGLLHL